jgi:hypothetical protein
MTTLSELQSWHDDALTAAVPYVTHAASRADSAFGQQYTQVSGMGWEGQGASAANTSIGGDKALMSATNGHLYMVVSDIRSAAARLESAHSDLMSEIDRIGQQGYDVGEDLTVTPKPSSDPAYVQMVKQVQAAQLTTKLATNVANFMALETSTQAMLSGHTATVSGVDFVGRGGAPTWHVDHYDDPNHGHYDPNSPTPATPYEKAHHGSNFNDRVKLDTSMVTTSGPEFMVEGPPVKPDWPAPSLTGTGTGTQPFLPQLSKDLAAPPTGGSPPLLVLPTPNGPMTLLPPARNLPTDYSPPGEPFLPHLPEILSTAPTAPATPVGIPLPGTPLIAAPPVMTAMPDDQYMPLPNPGYFPASVSPGGVMAGASLGCIGGMGGLAGLLAITGPGEVGAPLGCALGASMGVTGGVLAPVFNNVLHGMSVADSFRWDGE